MTLREAFDRYCSNVITYNDQSDQVRYTHYFVLKLLQRQVGNIEIEFLTFGHVRELKAHLQSYLGSGTVREYLTRLRMVLKYSLEEGYPVLHYTKVKLPPRSNRTPQFLTPEQVAMLIGVAGEGQRGYPKINRLRNKAVISLFYASGIRSAELRRLDRLDIQEDNTFTVRSGKNKKDRLCFLDTRTALLLHDYLEFRTDCHPALFLAHQSGLRISKGTVQHIFENVRKKVSFPEKAHPHTLRHSFATDLLRNKANMRYVQVMLGHANIQTTQVYTHVVDPDLQAVYEASHHC